MMHRFLFLGLMVFGFALGATGFATPAAAPKITPAPSYPGGPGCQKDAGAAAWLAPCIGPEGTVITIYPERVLTSAPAKLVFIPEFPIPGGSALMHEILTITGPGFSLKAPKELCVYPAAPGAYSRKWDVQLLTADGKNLGRIGVYTMKCGPGATPSPSVTAAPAPPAKCGSAPGAGAAIAPCAGPIGTRIGIYALRVLHDPFDLLRFERVAGSACYAPACGPTVVLAKVQNDGSRYVSAPAELCVYGPKWSTYAFGKAGTAFGLAGIFTIDCRVRPGAKPSASAKPPPPGGGGGGGGGKATPKPSPSPSPTPTPKKTPKPKATSTPKPTATPTPTSQGSPIVFAPRLPNPTPSPSAKPSTGTLTGSNTQTSNATPTPKPTVSPTPQGGCLPAPGSPVTINGCPLIPTQIIQLNLVGTTGFQPTAVVFQPAGPASPPQQPLTAPLQHTPNGGLGFTLPTAACRHVVTQWNLFAMDAAGVQIPIGLYVTNC